MKHSHVFLLSMIVPLAFFVFGCSGQPSQMFLLTQDARNQATAEHADQFAPDFWNPAEQAWQEANRKIDAKSYGEADRLLLKAKTNFVKARDVAKSKREVAVNYINSMKETITIRLKSDLKDNPAAGKLSPARKKEFDAAIKQIEDSVAKVTEQVQNGQYAEAKYLVDKTVREVWDTQQEFFKK
ncbi:MAG: DUF4398 domain-containing protein [Acidobacteriia bacterium]|nr:DUF4398 domain-containing protein [Terriglobia bacterium]